MISAKIMESIIDPNVEIVPVRYTMCLEEFRQVTDASQGSLFHAILFAFQYGFIKGQRAGRRKEGAK